MVLNIAEPHRTAEPSWPNPLHKLTLAVAHALVPDQIFEAAIDCLHDSLGIERSSLLLFDDAGVMRFVASRGLSDDYRDAVDGHSPWSPVTTDATPVLVEDVRREPSLASLRATIEGEGIRALAFIPLNLGTTLLGKFMLYYGEPHEFTEREILTVQAIAAHVAFAIDQHRHLERERGLRQLLEAEVQTAEVVQVQLTSLIEASGALMSTHHGPNAVESILRIEMQLLGADGYAIWRYVEASDEWEILSSEGLSAAFVAESTVRDRRGQRELREPMVVEDVSRDERLSSFQERYGREGIKSIFVSPLLMGSGQHGTLTFYYRTPHAFSDLEVRVGSALANLASASLSSARLFAETTEARSALEYANAQLEETASALRAANAAKDEFLGLVSHELKTPLTTIRGNADLLFRRRGALDEATQQSALADIVSDGDRLSRIIENLLLIARIEQGQPLEAEPLLVVRLVRRVVARHGEQHPKRRFEIVDDGDPRPVLFSEAALEQVMENLITNAEKYSPPGEAIVIELHRGPDEVVVRVLDRGVGIEDGDADRYFEPFYRSSTARRHAGGLGIGLSVCKRLIEAYDGKMWARRRDDGGSEFGFALPINDEVDGLFDE